VGSSLRQVHAARTRPSRQTPEECGRGLRTDDPIGPREAQLLGKWRSNPPAIRSVAASIVAQARCPSTAASIAMLTWLSMGPRESLGATSLKRRRKCTHPVQSALTDPWVHDSRSQGCDRSELLLLWRKRHAINHARGSPRLPREAAAETSRPCTPQGEGRRVCNNAQHNSATLKACGLPIEAGADRAASISMS
jgi:hypothetical protein